MLDSAEDPLFSDKAKQLMRQQWLLAQMKARKNSYTDPTQCSLFCGTYNVNGKANLGTESLSNWLFPDGDKGEAKDMYILGFQEIVELTPVNVAVDPQGASRTKFWLNNIASCLVQHNNTSGVDPFVLVGVHHLVGVMLCIYAKESLCNAIQDVRWATNAVGVMGVMGNKGGVTCRFSIHSTSICVVCAHLAASRDNVAHRNADFKNIMKQTLLKVDKNNRFSTLNQTTLLNSAETTSMGKFYALTNEENANVDFLICDHDIVFWIGDFNYRIDVSLARQEILDMIMSDRLSDLRIFDQLNMERSLGRVFEHFVEGELTFPPTYKFQVGTDIYENREGKKKRPPAWCDRILWSEKNNTHKQQGMSLRSAKVGTDADAQTSATSTSSSDMTNHEHEPLPNRCKAVQQVSYRSADLHASDHKPVSAEFQVTVRCIDGQREQELYYKLLKELDKLENDHQPKVEVGPLDFHVERMGYMSQVVFTLDITNIGETMANWRFVPKLDEDSVSAQWCTARPSLGMLSPKESTTIKIEVFADLRSLPFLLSKLTAVAPVSDSTCDSKISPPLPPTLAVSSTDVSSCGVSKINDVDDDGDNEEDEDNSGDNDGNDDYTKDVDDGDDNIFVAGAQPMHEIPDIIDTACMSKKEDKEKEEEDEEEEEEDERSNNKATQLGVVVPLEDIMVLRVDNGRDYFITLSANFCPSQDDMTEMASLHAMFGGTAAGLIRGSRDSMSGRMQETEQDVTDSCFSSEDVKQNSLKIGAEKIKKRWSSLQNNLSKMKTTVQTAAAAKRQSGNSLPDSGVTARSKGGSFDYESDESDDEMLTSRVTSVRVNRTSNGNSNSNSSP